jgi:hypothetical protein
VGIISGDAWSSAASVVIFSTALCAPIPFGSKDGEPEEALEGAESVSASAERNQEPCAEADASGDGLAAGGSPGIVVAIVGTFVFPWANAGAVVPGAGARFVVWIVLSEPLPAWFVESNED